MSNQAPVATSGVPAARGKRQSRRRRLRSQTCTSRSRRTLASSSHVTYGQTGPSGPLGAGFAQRAVAAGGRDSFGARARICLDGCIDAGRRSVHRHGTRGSPLPGAATDRTASAGPGRAVDELRQLPALAERRGRAASAPLARKHGSGTGRRYGAHLDIRRTRPGRFLLLSQGRIVWRSANLYPRDGDGVAFGPHRFAFASYRHGIYLTDLQRAEQLVLPGRALYPYSFTSSGQLIVTGPHTITLLSPAGTALRRFPYRSRNG